MSFPSFLIAVGDIIIPGAWPRVARMPADGYWRTNRTVCGSTTSTAFTSATSDRRRDLFASSISRSMVNFTAAAAKSVPSWNLTPFRS